MTEKNPVLINRIFCYIWEYSRGKCSRRSDGRFLFTFGRGNRLLRLNAQIGFSEPCPATCRVLWKK
ncbi:MAG: hypothetical protein DBY04_00325 [Clostridiales bacterium]|nr:MAG: hypothetical protein DBY04_00325 [Clostridiales bacterium]